MIFFHVTPLENLESILENGLQVGVKTTSDQHEPLGVYLSSNWIELLASKTFMEIFRYEQLAILSVQVSMDGLLQDPEYIVDEECEPFIVRVAPCNICPLNIEHLHTVDVRQYSKPIQFSLCADEELKEWLYAHVMETEQLEQPLERVKTTYLERICKMLGDSIIDPETFLLGPV